MREFELFLLSMKNDGKTDTTIKNSEKYVGEFLKVLDLKSIQEVQTLTRSDIDFYLSVLLEHGNADSSRRTKMGYVKMFFNYLEERELIDKNITKSIKITATKKELVCPTISDAYAILEYAKNSNSKDDFAITLTLMTSGLRVSELIMLKEKDLTESGIKVLGKGKKERTVALSKQTVRTLRSYIYKTRDRLWPLTREEFKRNRNTQIYHMYKNYDSYKETIDDSIKNRYIFLSKSGSKMSEPGINARLKRIARAVGVDEDIVSPHKMRHVYATNLLENGADMDVISQLLGHSNVAVTHSVYAKTSVKRIRDTIDTIDLTGGIVK